jgi:hypothetical protein
VNCITYIASTTSTILAVLDVLDVLDILNILAGLVVLAGLCSLWVSNSFLFCLGISKIASKNNNSSQQMNLFRESRKHWTKSMLRFWKLFSESQSSNWIDTMKQMKEMEWSKQWSIELLLTALRLRDAYPIVGRPILLVEIMTMLLRKPVFGKILNAAHIHKHVSHDSIIDAIDDE